MALRIRSSGRVMCAAIHPAEPGDVYVHDGVSYELTVVRRLLVTEPIERHAVHGEWWWRNEVPEGIRPEVW